MHSRIWSLSLYVLKAASLALLKPPQDIDLPVNNSFFTLTSNAPNTSNASISSSTSVHPLSSPIGSQSNSRLSRAGYECDKIKYGQPAVDSCREAFGWMGSGQEILNYGDRSVTRPTGTVDVLLPLRYSSSDGTCIIELFTTEDGDIDFWTPTQLKGSIYRLLTKCLFWGEHQGGIGRRLGDMERLSVVVEQWNPHVECSETSQTPRLFACQSALDNMPTSFSQQVFGAQGAPSVDVALPIRYSGPDSICTIEVSLTEPPIQANWYSIWGAAESVVAMCVRSRKEGFSIGRSGDSEIRVRVMS